MYRKNAGAEWSVYPYYTKNTLANSNDKHGIIYIDTLQLGEYAFAMKDYTMGISHPAPKNKIADLNIFPNPTKDMLTVEFDASLLKSLSNALLIISDSSGKIIYKEKLDSHRNSMNINTSAYKSGMYNISLSVKDTVTAKNKFVVAH